MVYQTYQPGCPCCFPLYHRLQLSEPRLQPRLLSVVLDTLETFFLSYLEKMSLILPRKDGCFVLATVGLGLVRRCGTRSTCSDRPRSVAKLRADLGLVISTGPLDCWSTKRKPSNALRNAGSCSFILFIALGEDS
jgi:hypothetical protein